MTILEIRPPSKGKPAYHSNSPSKEAHAFCIKRLFIINWLADWRSNLPKGRRIQFKIMHHGINIAFHGKIHTLSCFDKIHPKVIYGDPSDSSTGSLHLKRFASLFMNAVTLST